MTRGVSVNNGAAVDGSALHRYSVGMGKKQEKKPARVMQKKKRKGMGALIAALAVVLFCAACALVYLFAFPRVSIVADSSFFQVVPSSDLIRLRLNYAFGGTRLSVVKLDDQCFSFKDLFVNAVSKIKGKTVVLSPMVSEYAIAEDVDVSSVLEQSTVIGITVDKENTCFDCILIPDELPGWLDASSIVEAETSKMSQNVALVYSANKVSYIQDIIDAFPAGHVSVFEKKGSSAIFASNTLEEMDRQGIVLALCPYVSTFYRFFSNETTVQWVVDYRFASVVPEKNLYAVVIPDFSGLRYVAEDVEKHSNTLKTLPYIYVKR